MSKFLSLKLSNHIRRDRLAKTLTGTTSCKQNLNSVLLSCQHTSLLWHTQIFYFSQEHEFFRYTLVFMFFYNQRIRLVYIVDPNQSVLPRMRKIPQYQKVYIINLFFFLFSMTQLQNNNYYSLQFYGLISLSWVVLTRPLMQMQSNIHWDWRYMKAWMIRKFKTASSFTWIAGNFSALCMRYNYYNIFVPVTYKSFWRNIYLLHNNFIP